MAEGDVIDVDEDLVLALLVPHLVTCLAGVDQTRGSSGILGSGGAPAAAAGLDGAAGLGVLGQVPVEGGAVHAGEAQEFGDVGALVGGGAQGEPESVFGSGGAGGLICVVLGVAGVVPGFRSGCGSSDRGAGQVVELGPDGGEVGGSAGG
jgi:hypothetical protein